MYVLHSAGDYKERSLGASLQTSFRTGTKTAKGRKHKRRDPEQEQGTAGGRGTKRRALQHTNFALHHRPQSLTLSPFPKPFPSERAPGGSSSQHNPRGGGRATVCLGVGWVA